MLALHGAIGCSRFVWKEDPFTPDQAPTSEVVTAGRDTTFVFHAPSYYLLAAKRNALWNRDVLDDVAWRYRALFGEAPPPIAVKLDSATAVASTDSTWRGLPLVTVGPPRHPPEMNDAARRKRERDESADSVRAGLVIRPIVAASAAATWLAARASALRGSENQPGGAERPSPTAGRLPAWMHAGALRILAAGGAPDRAAAALRTKPKGIVPLPALFAVTWPAEPNAVEMAAPDAAVLDADRSALGEPPPRRQRRTPIPGVSPMFGSQAVSVLAFIHERDAGLVARLADELPRGASVDAVLASSATLPHDVAGLEAEWRKWLRRSTKRR